MFTVSNTLGEWHSYQEFWDETVEPLYNLRDKFKELYNKAIGTGDIDPKRIEYRVPAGSIVFTECKTMIGALEDAREWAIAHQLGCNNDIMDRVRKDSKFASRCRLLRMESDAIIYPDSKPHHSYDPRKLLGSQDKAPESDEIVMIMDLCTDVVALMSNVIQYKKRCDDVAWLVNTVVSELYTVYHAYYQFLIAALDIDYTAAMIDDRVKAYILGYLDKDELWTIHESSTELWLTREDIMERERAEREAREAEEQRKRDAEKAEEDKRKEAEYVVKRKADFTHHGERFNAIINTFTAHGVVVKGSAEVIEYFKTNDYDPNWEHNEFAVYAGRMFKTINFIAALIGCDIELLDDSELTEHVIKCFGFIDSECNTGYLKDLLSLNDETLDTRIELVNHTLRRIVKDEHHLRVEVSEQLGCGDMVRIVVD